MSTWAERYKGNAVWAQLERLGPSLDQALQREDLTVEHVDTLERIRVVLAYLGKRVSSVEPALTTTTGLDNLAEALKQTIGHVDAFGQTLDQNQLNNASSQADQALQHSLNIFLPTPAQLEGLGDAAARYRNTTSALLEGFQKEADLRKADIVALDARLKELQAVTASEQQRMGSALNDWQTQFNAAQASREQQGSTQLGTFQEQFSATQASRDSRDNEAQTKRQTRFDELHADYSTKLTERAAEFEKVTATLSTDYEAGAATLRTKYESEATTILEAIETQRAKVEKLVGVIGNLGVTSGYQKAANQALWALRFWQFVAVGAMGFLVYIAYNKFLPAAQGQGWQPPAATASSAANPKAPTISEPKSFDWPGLALRIYVSLTVGVLAAYAGTQADKYYRIERKNRKMALELEAIGPFLQPLPETEQQKFRVMIGDRSFGRDDDPTSETSPATVVQLLTSKEGRAGLAELLKVLKKD